MSETAQVHQGDALEVLRTLPDASIALTITSPPYYRQRDYGMPGQIGREPTVGAYLDRLGLVLAELLRVSDDRACCFVVIGDTYDKGRLLLVPHRLAVLAADLGWTVRNDIIWAKTDPPPESPRTRWRASHEHVLFLTRRPSGYRFSVDPIRVPHAPATLRRWGGGQTYGGAKSTARKNESDSRMRHGTTFRLNPLGCVPTDVWRIACTGGGVRHYAMFPEPLIRPMIEACSGPGEMVLDPFAGAGTTGVVAVSLSRRFTGIDLNPEYVELARQAIATK